jgi:RNA recognition motif-containing protein
MSIRLYVGNLPKELSRQELEAVFAEAGDTISTKVITDRKTGECRGFGFVTVKNNEQADEIIEKYNGYVLKENPIKIEKALPRNKGKAEDEQQPAVASSAGSATSGSPDKGNRRNKGGNKTRRTTGTSSNDSDSVQPDPRWASELEKLKELLAAQTTNT